MKLKYNPKYNLRLLASDQAGQPDSREVLFVLLFSAIFLRITVSDVLTMQRNLGNLKGEDNIFFFFRV